MNRIAEILALLADPSSLTDETVGALEAELLDLFAAIRAGEVEDVASTDVETLRSITDAVESLRALASERYVAAEALAEEIAALEATLAGPAAEEAPEAEVVDVEPEEEPVAEPVAEDEPAVEEEPAEEPQAVAAAADAPARPSLGAVAGRQPARTRPRSEAPAPKRSNVAIVAADGTSLPDWGAAVEHIAREFPRVGRNAGKRHLVSLQGTYSQDRVLSDVDETGNRERVERVMGQATDPNAWSAEAITAAGWCAPSEVDYEVVTQAGAQRPVRDSLPDFQATRGGIRLPVSPTLADIDTAGADAAVSLWTETNQDTEIDTKPVQAIDCPDFAEFRTYMVTKRLRFGNGASRAFPENVAAWERLALAAHARMAETALLDGIKNDAGTTVITQPTNTLSATRDLLELVIRLTTFMRHSERMPGDARVRALLPSWVLALAQADLVRGEHEDPSMFVAAQSEIAGLLNEAGVTATFYADSPSTGTSQLLTKQVDAGAPADWPCDVQFGLYFEGHFGFLNGGAIDLGVVRDTSLNERNDFETFAETVEGVFARRGPEALWVTQRLIPDGTYSAPVEPTIDCAS